MRTLNNKKLIIRSSGKLVRDYLHVDDAASAYILIMNKLIHNKKNKLLIYNVGSKFNLSVTQLVKLILKIMKKNNLEPKILNYSKSEIKIQKLNFHKIKKELKWRQKISMQEGMRTTISWYKKNFKYVGKIFD